MMAAFNVTRLAELGYDVNTTLGLANPQDSRFAARDYSADAFTPDAIRSRLASLINLHAYPTATPVIQGFVAESSALRSIMPSRSAQTLISCVNTLGSRIYWLMLGILYLLL